MGVDTKENMVTNDVAYGETSDEGASLRGKFHSMQVSLLSVLSNCGRLTLNTRPRLNGCRRKSKPHFFNVALRWSEQIMGKNKDLVDAANTYLENPDDPTTSQVERCIYHSFQHE